MSVCTLGLYEIYWFYRNWRCIRHREQSNIAPALRALLAIFYCYQCFARVRAYDTEKNGSSPLAAGSLATGWIVATLLWKLPDPYWWLSLLAFVFLLPVQARANRLNAQVSPLHHRNASVRGWDWLAVIPGGALLLLAFLGTLLVPDRDERTEDSVHAFHRADALPLRAGKAVGRPHAPLVASRYPLNRSTARSMNALTLRDARSPWCCSACTGTAGGANFESTSTSAPEAICSSTM